MNHFDIDARINELEIKSAHQEHTIEQLNQIIIEQQNNLERLTKQLEHLNLKLVNLEENTAKEEPEPPPPHY